MGSFVIRDDFYNINISIFLQNLNEYDKKRGLKQKIYL